ncbi:MAG: hypothetical protein EPO21_18470 [Chloroflexota bacterium]|nr:MAG: hypothetical protein EPO21_18470 [Chloroflexota bacterium]
MQFYALSALINVVTTLILGVIVLIRNPRNRLNLTFSVFSLNISLWSLCYFIWQVSTTPGQALFWSRALMVFATGIPAFYLHLVTVLVGLVRRRARMLRLSYVIFAFFLLINVSTSLFVASVRPISPFNFWPQPGPLFYLFIVLWLVQIGYTTSLLYVALRHATGMTRLQIKYVFWGMVIGYCGGVTNYFLWFGIPIPPFGNVLVSVYVALTAYAIVKHRFFDIRPIVARSLAFTSLVVVIAGFYVGAIFLISRSFLGGSLDTSAALVYALLTLFVAFTFQPLKRLFEKMTDRVFFLDRYDSEQFLNHMGTILSSTISLDRLGDKVLEGLMATIRTDNAVLLVIKKDELTHVISRGGHRRYEAWEFTRFFNHQAVYLFDELPEGKQKEELRAKDLGCVLPLRIKGKPLGVLALGFKKSGGIYTSQDIDVLEVFAKQLSIAVENALQFEEIQQFSEKLKVKVKEATANLRVANEKLRELDKRKDEFLNVAAHELRAPLTAVRGYLSMVIDGDAGPISPQMAQFLAGAIEGAEREVRLVNNLLSVARIEENRLVYQMGEVDLCHVCKTVFDEFKLDAQQKGLEYAIVGADEGLQDRVYVDQDRIHEVVANFVSNAIKYTDKGAVALKLSQTAAAGIRFEVSDTGYGMTEDEQHRLFQKFYRAESSAGRVLGTGLGLYITKLLIDRFGGRLGLTSEKGKGSTFWFELPTVKGTQERTGGQSRHETVIANG